MKKILNFFRSKNKKNILLSLVLAFLIFLSVGVSVLPTKKASALSTSGYNIYDYPWANFFRADSISLTYDHDAGYTASFNKTSDMITITITDTSIFSGISLQLNDVALHSSLGIFPTLKESGNYYFSCLVECPDIDVSFMDFFIQCSDSDSSNIFTCYNNNWSYFHYEYTNGITLKVMFRDSYVHDYPFSEGDVIYISQFQLTYGESKYEYTEYFYDLDTLPNPPPSVEGDSSSEDSSSSDDSGSDDDSSGGIIPPPDLEGDYLDGYLAGLEYGKYGVFSQCQCYIQLNYQYEYERIKITDDFFIYGGLDLSKFLPLVENKENVLSSYIYFYFPRGSYPVSSELSFSATGITDAFVENSWPVRFQNTPHAQSLSWSLVSSETLTSDRNIYKSNTISKSFTGSDVILSFKTPTFSTFDYLSGLTITVSNNLYELGYNAGLTVNGQDRYDAGYSSGLIVGEDIGFKKGLNQGLSGDPYGAVEFMYSFLDMPGRILSNWLNFEFLGVNLMGLVTFLLSITLFVFVLKKAV